MSLLFLLVAFQNLKIRPISENAKTSCTRLDETELAMTTKSSLWTLGITVSNDAMQISKGRKSIYSPSDQ